MDAEHSLAMPAGDFGPDVFLRYQQELMSSVSQYAVAVWEKSRRTGFSWACGAIAVLTAAAAAEAGGQDVLYIGYNKEMAREFIDYVGEWAVQLGEACSEVGEEIFTDPNHPEKEIMAFRVQFASGFKVLALPSVPRSLRGMQGLVIIDEAAFHDDLEGVMKAAFALLIWGGKVVIISTHDGDANPFNVLVQDIRAGRKPGYFLGRLTFDEALADGLYRRVCLTTGKEWTAEGEVKWAAEIRAIYGANADEELDVNPSAGSGTYLSAAVIERQMRKSIPVVRLQLPDSFKMLAEHLREAETRDFCERELMPLLENLDPNLAHVFAQDFARSRDLSVLIPAAICRDLKLRALFTLEMRNVPYETQKQILFYIVDRLPRFRAGKLDAGGNGGYLAEVAQQRYGARIEAVMLSEGWYRENMPRWKAMFDDGMLEISLDAEVLDDHRLVRLIGGVGRVPPERTGAKDKKRHGDSAITTALLVAASRAEPEEYGYEAAPLRPASAGARESFYQTADAANQAQDDAQRGGGIFPALSRRSY